MMHYYFVKELHNDSICQINVMFQLQGLGLAKKFQGLGRFA